MKAIGDWPQGSLQILSLNNTLPKRRSSYITCKGVEFLSASPGLKALTELYVSNHDLRNEGVKIISRAPFFLQLTSLDLSQNNVDDWGVEFLLQPHSSHSISLNLSDNNITDQVMKSIEYYMFEHPVRKFPYLKELILEGTGIKDKESFQKIFEEKGIILKL